MKLFQKASDGGKDSGVSAYFLIEWKRVFSIALMSSVILWKGKL